MHNIIYDVLCFQLNVYIMTEVLQNMHTFQKLKMLTFPTPSLFMSNRNFTSIHGNAPLIWLYKKMLPKMRQYKKMLPKMRHFIQSTVALICVSGVVLKETTHFSKADF